MAFKIGQIQVGDAAFSQITLLHLLLLLLGHITAIAACCYRQSNVVVGLSVGHIRDPCKNG